MDQNAAATHSHPPPGLLRPGSLEWQIAKGGKAAPFLPLLLDLAQISTPTLHLLSALPEAAEGIIQTSYIAEVNSPQGQEGGGGRDVSVIVVA